MSRGIPTNRVPEVVVDGIKEAARQWFEMSGSYLQTAPEYMLTVVVAQQLMADIEAGKRTLFMESRVNSTLKDAGGVKRGKRAVQLRHELGRFDIVLGNRAGVPRVLIELKTRFRYGSRLTGAAADLDRMCHSLLHGNETNIHMGIFAAFVFTKQPARKDSSTGDRLRRQWQDGWCKEIRSWSWADRPKRWSELLAIKPLLTVLYEDNDVSWGVITATVKRKGGPSTID